MNPYLNDDLVALGGFLGGFLGARERYTAADVVEYLLAGASAGVPT